MTAAARLGDSSPLAYIRSDNMTAQKQRVTTHDEARDHTLRAVRMKKLAPYTSLLVTDRDATDWVAAGTGTRGFLHSFIWGF